MRKVSDVLKGLILFGIIITGCSGSEYQKLVKRELNSGKYYDSLFLNFYFGDTREEFFKKGWDQNKKGLIRQGPRNRNVEHLLRSSDSTESTIQMLFYPEFDEKSQIKKMDISFEYVAWAPWNKKYFSDSLLFAVQDTLMKWYGGNQFLKVTYDAPPYEVWVKVDGNRSISMSILDERQVKGMIKDLRHPDYSK